MKDRAKFIGIVIVAISLAFRFNFTVSAKEFYKLSSLAPGATPFVVNTTFVKIVQKYNPDIEIQAGAFIAGVGLLFQEWMKTSATKVKETETLPA